MKPNPKWVIFDVGQVLYDFDRFAKDLAKQLKIKEEILISQISVNARDSSLEGQITVEQFWKKTMTVLNKEQEYERLIDAWNNDLTYWLQDTKKLFGELNKVGYLLAILTNNWRNQSDDLSKNLSSYGDIKFIFESSVEKLSKPDKRLYKLVEERIGAKGDEIYFIDDSVKNIESAKEIGWQTFLYQIGDDDGKTSNNLIRKQLL